MWVTVSVLLSCLGPCNLCFICCMMPLFHVDIYCMLPLLHDGANAPAACKCAIAHAFKQFTQFTRVAQWGCPREEDRP